MHILEILDEVPDPRRFNTRHDLTDLLFVAFLAMLCGATNCTEFAEFTEGRLQFLRQFVPLKNGAPSHDTFSDVFRILDPDAFNAAFQRLMTAFGARARDETQGQIAVDGKCLRRAYEKGRAHMPPLVVTVFECQTFLSLTQQVAAEGGEAEAAIRALRLLDLEGCVVSADALHCHRRFTQTVVDGGGDYLVPVKANQSKLAAEAAKALDAAAGIKPPSAQTQDAAHGRHELRRAFVVPFQQSEGKNALVGLAAVARVEVWRAQGEKPAVHEVRDFALSWLATPEEVLSYVRGHWAIENNLHWQLDVLMLEDQNRSRKQNAATNQAILRRLVLNVLHADPRKIPLASKRRKARWNDQELLNLMTHMR